MLTPINSKVAQKIRKLIPLGTISLSRFNAICAKIQLYEVAAGEFLFKKGDIAPDLVYLLAGEVSLQALGMQIEVLHARQNAARFALAHQIPRKIDALALTPISYIRINAEYLLDNELNQEVMETMETVDADADDWMTALLKSPIFKRLPPANLQKLLTGLQDVNVAKDTVILKQGDEGQYFYLIKQGQCVISRKPNPNTREIILAQLRAGDIFGEDSLLSEQPVSAFVTALTPVSLLRLDKAQFVNLIKEPILKYIEASELEAEILAGALVVDVRAEEAFKLWHLQGSLCIPFFTLRMQLQLKMLDRKRSVVVVCENGGLSKAAAFLFLRYKIPTKILRRGLASLGNMDSKGWRFVYGSEKQVELASENVVTDNAISNSEPDYAALQQELSEIKQLYAEAIQEKERIEKNYRVLYKQTEKLKELLHKYHTD